MNARLGSDLVSRDCIMIDTINHNAIMQLSYTRDILLW